MTTPTDGLGQRVLPPGSARSRRILFGAVGALVLLFLVLPTAAAFATDWMWFHEIGFDTVFVASFFWRIALFLLGGAAAFTFVFFNARAAIGGPVPAAFIVTNTATGAHIDLSRFIPRIAWIVSILVGLGVAGSTASDWMTYVVAFRGAHVGTVDALFGRDLGFYLFTLPALDNVLNGCIGLVTLALIATAVIYALRGALAFAARRRVTAAPHAARHLAALLIALFVFIALRLWFVTSSNLLWSTTGPLVGASYTDVHVTLPAIRLSALVAIATVGLIVYGLTRGQLARFTIIGVALYAVVGVVGRGILPFAVQRLEVVPNELEREKPYLQRHLAATRAAWGLDSVTTRDLAGDRQLTMADIRANSPTIDNVRLWERDLVKQSFAQLQEIRTYYDFVSVSDDRYTIDGKYRQVHLSARELNVASLPTRTFINERLTYTHGMGVAMAPVNQVTSEGLPLLLVKDLPPASTGSVKVTRPQIYYGELTNSYVFVGARQKEFDYPSGDGDVQTMYSGRGGIPVGAFLRRALFAYRLGSLKILLSDDITGAAKILYRRNIRDRAQTALPFLGFDAEPYLVITDAGELKWILDGYTGSERYPYAYRTQEGTSYLRNSVKVVIDAYDGTVDAYIADPGDPIIRTLDRIFAGIFKPMSAMPADLRRHVRYPGDLFGIQAVLQATYHMREPETFYHREDEWQLPSNGARNERINPFMRHIILRLPGETNPEFIYMIPFTPRGKDNLAAWMVARMDGAHYGEMVVYRFPKQSLVFGPKQVANRINQDTDVSRQLTLWDQKGSQVLRGELLVIPIEESLIYVQPIFLRAEGGTIPELKRVVVTHGSQVVMSETLESALATLFGSAPGVRSIVAPAESLRASSAFSSLLQEAQQHYDRAIAAQRAGNWAEYGRELDALGDVIRRMRGAK